MPERLAVFVLSSRPRALLVVFVTLLEFFSVSLRVAQAQGTNSRSGAFVYTGGTGYSDGSNVRINGYVINGTTGTLSNASGTPFTTSGTISAMVAHPSGKFVYAALGNGTGGLAAFTVDSFVGTLTPVPGGWYAQQEAGSGGTILAIDPAGKFLYMSGISSNLYAFAIDASTGALSVVPGSPFSSNGAYAVAIDPSGKYLIASSGSDALAYAIDGSTGALTGAGSVVNGCGGVFMAFEPSGHFLYGISGAGITACSFNSSSGALAPVTGSPLVSAEGSFRGLAIHPSGAFLYASNSSCAGGTAPTLYGYVIDPASGRLD